MNVSMEGSRNVVFEYSLKIAAERSLNIPFERSWNVPQEHSENIALERSKNTDIFLVLGTFLERSDGTFRTFHGNMNMTLDNGIIENAIEFACEELVFEFKKSSSRLLFS